MPKRTNAFQKVVHLAQLHLAAGAVVTESKLLTDLVTGTKREVDVCIETSIAEHAVLVCIECRDHARPADVSWVDAMKCKHDRLPTHGLVLVSRSGFTPEAAQVARVSGIEALALEEIDETAVARLFGTDGSLWAKSCTLTVAKVVARVAEHENLPAENVVTSPDNHVFAEDGTQLGSVRQLVEVALRSATMGDQLMRQAETDHRFFEARWDNPKFKDGARLCLQKLDPRCLRAIDYLQMSGPAAVTIAPFRLRGGTLGRVQIGWGVGTILDQPALLVATRDREGTQKVTLTFGKGVPIEGDERGLTRG